MGLGVVLLGVVLWTAVRTAWIGDDSQITLHQVWNFVTGEGMIYNYNGRVQAFSHPTWFFCAERCGPGN